MYSYAKALHARASSAKSRWARSGSLFAPERVHRASDDARALRTAAALVRHITGHVVGATDVRRLRAAPLAPASGRAR